MTSYHIHCLKEFVIRYFLWEEVTVFLEVQDSFEAISCAVCHNPATVLGAKWESSLKANRTAVDKGQDAPLGIAWVNFGWGCFSENQICRPPKMIIWATCEKSIESICIFQFNTKKLETEIMVKMTQCLLHKCFEQRNSCKWWILRVTKFHIYFPQTNFFCSLLDSFVTFVFKNILYFQGAFSQKRQRVDHTQAGKLCSPWTTRIRRGKCNNIDPCNNNNKPTDPAHLSVELVIVWRILWDLCQFQPGMSIVQGVPELLLLMCTTLKITQMKEVLEVHLVPS